MCNGKYDVLDTNDAQQLAGILQEAFPEAGENAVIESLDIAASQVRHSEIRGKLATITLETVDCPMCGSAEVMEVNSVNDACFACGAIYG